ncbi:hypothetical protein D9758_009283 [Tetrapyrgos nigripes]|uniref:SKP1 component POZ domain-containing protein n=1 Tax=Tetrapyrgos nigripes TaxID=182062 RepID=A0A8H5LPM2_9AGAR|nr:hypothetical protein D9758_009283 [Tetrapyrgos nigripes]
MHLSTLPIFLCVWCIIMTATAIAQDYIILESSDKTQFTLRTDIARHGMQSFLDRADLKPGEDAVIRIPDAASATVKLVIEYCEFHYNNPDPAQPHVREWKQNFLKDVDPKIIYRLQSAAKFLDIPDLSYLAGGAMADLSVGRGGRELIEMFGYEIPTEPPNPPPDSRPWRWHVEKDEDEMVIGSGYVLTAEDLISHGLPLPNLDDSRRLCKCTPETML